MPTEVKWSWLLAGALAAGMSLSAQEAATAPVIAPEQVALAARINGLAVDLVQCQVAERGNFCYSPLSAASALLQLAPGLKHVPAKQIEAKLVAPEQDLVATMATLRALSSRVGVSGAVEWRHLQQVWYDRHVQFDEQWLATLRRLDVPCTPFGHGDGLDELRQRIRGQVTASLDEVVGAESMPLQDLDVDTRLVLVDALRLQAGWKHGFEPERSGVGDFVVAPRRSIQVTFLQQERDLPYGLVDSVEVVRSELVAPGLVLDLARTQNPRRVQVALQALCEGDWSAATPRLQSRRVALAVPSIEIDRLLSLEEVARGSGCGRPELRVAPVGDQRFGVLGTFATRFAIGEQGIGAISISEISAFGPGAVEPRITYLTFDRAFAFAVRDTASGLVLVCGIVREPQPMRVGEAEDRDR